MARPLLFIPNRQVGAGKEARTEGSARCACTRAGCCCCCSYTIAICRFNQEEAHPWSVEDEPIKVEMPKPRLEMERDVIGRR